MLGANMVEAAFTSSASKSRRKAIGNSPMAKKSTLRTNLQNFKGEFLAQNVFLTEDAAFNDKPVYDSSTGRVFKSAVLKDIGGKRIGVIGQAFPYVPIAHPKRFTPDWTFGIREEELQKLVDDVRGGQHADAVLLLSAHNGMDVDLKLASRVTGIDITWAATPTTPCRGRWSLPMPAARRWSPMPDRTENSLPCSTSTSAGARSRTSATRCFRYSPI